MPSCESSNNELWAQSRSSKGVGLVTNWHLTILATSTIADELYQHVNICTLRPALMPQIHTT